MAYREKKEFESSVFNISLAYLEDLRIYFRAADAANLSNDYPAWFAYEKIIYSRICPALDKTERKDKEDQIKDCAEELIRHSNKRTNGRDIIYGAIRSKLEKLDRDLKILATKKGMLLLSTDDATTVMTRM